MSAHEKTKITKGVREMTTKELIQWLNDYANRNGHNADDRENLELIKRRLLTYLDGKEMYDAMSAVLCDPEGNPCFLGSDGDRQVIADAMGRWKRSSSS